MAIAATRMARLAVIAEHFVNGGMIFHYAAFFKRCPVACLINMQAILEGRGHRWVTIPTDAIAIRFTGVGH